MIMIDKFLNLAERRPCAAAGSILAIFAAVEAAKLALFGFV